MRLRWTANSTYRMALSIAQTAAASSGRVKTDPTPTAALNWAVRATAAAEAATIWTWATAMGTAVAATTVAVTVTEQVTRTRSP